MPLVCFAFYAHLRECEAVSPEKSDVKKRTLERVQGVLQGKMHFFLSNFILVVLTISCYSLHIFLNFSQIHISENIKINFI